MGKTFVCAAMLFLLVGVGRSHSDVVVSSDQPHDALPVDQLQAWVSSGVSGIPFLLAEMRRVDWGKFAEDSCGEEYTGSLLQVAGDMAKRSTACARIFDDVLKSTMTSSKERLGILLGLSDAGRVPPVLSDGLVSCLSDPSPEIRMRASEVIARSGFRQAAPAIKAAMKREPNHSTRQRMSYHLSLLGDPEGDPQALRR